MAILIDRRGFLGGAAALLGASGCRSLGIGGPTPNLVFGVISDIHVTTPESTDVFRSILGYFRDRKVDAVVVAGDLTDWGLKSSLKYVSDAWESVFPNGVAPDGRKVERLFCTGNHDYEGWRYGDMTLDMHSLGYSEDEALVKLGMRRCWEEIFNEPFAAVRRRTVKGYDFICAEWDGWDKEADAWFAKNGSSLDKKKPFFFFTHCPIGGTTSSSVRDDGSPLYPQIPSLSGMPNAVAFTGHSHWTLNDERSIWQDGFTSISVPSTSYTTVPRGYENGEDSRDGTSRRSMGVLPARRNLERAQGFVVSVFDDRMEVERRDFAKGVEAAPAWIVTPPAAGASRYAFANSSKRTPVPQFPAGAALKAYTRNFETRSCRWTIMMMLEFPSARALKGRVYDYEVRIEMEDGSVAGVKRFLAPAFYMLEREEPAVQHFAVDAMSLPEHGKYRFRVYPRNCFGVCGKPIESAVFESKPGKAKVRS